MFTCGFFTSDWFLNWLPTFKNKLKSCFSGVIFILYIIKGFGQGFILPKDFVLVWTKLYYFIFSKKTQYILWFFVHCIQYIYQSQIFFLSNHFYRHDKNIFWNGYNLCMYVFIIHSTMHLLTKSEPNSIHQKYISCITMRQNIKMEK